MDIEKIEEAVGEAVGIVNIKKTTEKIEEEPAQRLKIDEVAEKEPIRKDTTEVEKEFMVETDAYPTVDRIMSRILKHLEGISGSFGSQGEATVVDSSTPQCCQLSQ